MRYIDYFYHSTQQKKCKPKNKKFARADWRGQSVIFYFVITIWRVPLTHSTFEPIACAI